MTRQAAPPPSSAASPARALPRGIRNHNPGNLRRSADPWQGLADRQPDGAFFTFRAPVWGLRALARTLITYQDRHGLRSIRAIIRRWAPPVENDTEAYVRTVARLTGLGPDQPLDLHRHQPLKALVAAIVTVENGQQPYTDAELDKALVLAGVEPPEAALEGSRTVRGGAVATAATVGGLGLAAVDGAFREARQVLAGLAGDLEAARWALLALTLIGLGWMLWARLDDHRRGLR